MSTGNMEWFLEDELLTNLIYSLKINFGFLQNPYCHWLNTETSQNIHRFQIQFDWQVQT